MTTTADRAGTSTHGTDMWRTTLLVVLVAALWTALPPSARAATPNSSGDAHGRATFGIGPSSGSGPDGRAAFNYDVTRGAQLTDRVALRNFTAQPVTVTVYPVDADPDAQGGAQLPPASVKPVKAGAWFHLSLTPGEQVTVGPRSTVILPFVVAVPTGATPGDHQAALIASLSTFALNKQGTRVRIDQRIAVRANLRVAGQLVPRLEIQQLHVAYHEPFTALRGTVTATYVVRNTGNVRLGAIQKVAVHELFGATASAQHPAAIPVLPPGASERVSVRVPDVVPELHARVVVTIQPVAATGDVDGALAPVQRTRGLWTVPWLLIAIAVLLVAGFFAVRWWRRRRRRRERDRVPGARPPRTREVVHA